MSTSSPSFPSFPTYSSFSHDHNMGPPTVFIVFAVLIVACIVISCVVRCAYASGAIEDHVAQPPPVQIVYPTCDHNVYPNHVMDLEGGNYAPMAPTPQYEVSMAVIVSSAPAMDTCSAPSTSHTS